MIEVTVTARLNPTEDVNKVIEAIRNLFPDIEIEVKGGYVVGHGSGIEVLRKFIDVIGREAIAPRTLALLKERMRGDSIVIPVDREVATVGRISYDEEGEMGPIWVEVRGDVEKVVDAIRALLDSP